mgnify:CR=1 FL=1
MITSFDAPSWRPGTKIQGNWQKKVYVIERLLGEGANGRVYLVRSERKQQKYALKVGFHLLDHQLEVNALAAQDRASWKRNPFLIESDDYVWHGKNYPFYVMRYIDGMNPEWFLEKYGQDCFGILGYQLLLKLHHFHDNGYVFGDLKPENVLVTKFGEVQLIDYGGVTEIGKSIRQYTQRYDRGYWGGGGRKADAAYDLFSFCVLSIQLVCGDQLSGIIQSGVERHPSQLLRIARDTPMLRSRLPFYKLALTGKYASAGEAASAWKQWMYSGQNMERDLDTKRLVQLFIVTALLFASTLWYVVK